MTGKFIKAPWLAVQFDIMRMQRCDIGLGPGRVIQPYVTASALGGTDCLAGQGHDPLAPALAKMEAAGGNDSPSAGTEKYSVANGGMDPGAQNPLGARALYIFQDGQDALPFARQSRVAVYRKAVSSGCVRLLNHDIVDLYERVSYHAPIVVYQAPLLGSA